MNELFWRWGGEKQAQGLNVACLMVTATSGSSPATPGQILLVAEDGESFGTVGGGATEYKLTQRALQAIAEQERVFTFELDHAEFGMTCGGSLCGTGSVLGSRFKLFIFGGGHVAQSLARIAALSGFSVQVIEDRPEFADAFTGSDFKADYRVLTAEDYATQLRIPARAYGVICTRGHLLDRDAMRFCVDQPFAYLGMIGSRRKVDEVFRQLREEGIAEEKLSRVFAPIGLDVASGLPQEIAISILAEMLLVKNNGSPRHKSR